MAPIFFSGAIFRWLVFRFSCTAIARPGHDVKPQMPGISPLPLVRGLPRGRRAGKPGGCIVPVAQQAPRMPAGIISGDAENSQGAYMKMTRAIPALAGGTAAVVALMAASPALANPALANPALANPAGLGRAGLPRGGAITSILKSGDIVTGVRGAGDGRVVLTGSAIGSQTSAFLFLGRLSAAPGATVSVLHPKFRGVTSSTFYGPDTHTFNPRAIPRGQVRAVGSYVSSASPRGVHDRGMIYLGPVSGRRGHWMRIDVPAHGWHVVGHVRACPRFQHRCHVMDTIPHSTMGNLVVGDYDLNPSVRGGLISGNAFIYNMARRRWTLLRLHGSLSTKTTLYAIWQDGGPGSPHYTLAGGSSARGGGRGFLVNYNERTGRFGRPSFYNAGNTPRVVTHFEGITAAPGGFNLVAMSSGASPWLAYIPVRGRSFGRAHWHLAAVSSSRLCPCDIVTGNTVWRNHIMGLYIPTSSPAPHTYLARIAAR
jgi:hypothetical protein